ncbi:MAG: translational machinery protein [Burkholderiaceae bacterium]|nr:translational machinery protein [Burkholderiaceae bacterium]MDO9089734.1 translational machinery protein [Burkholderiaceae bacterium]MDP1967944.1 translational machinery protein [Burkholderiaceae bacterium]
MSFNHAVVWLDHQQAHIIHFNADDSTVKTVKTHSHETRQHRTSGVPGSGKAPVNQAYLHEIAEGVADAKEVLVVGPGSAKLDLIKHIHKHDPAVGDKVVGVETIDHPTDPQLLAYAKKYFVKVDQMKGDAF